MHQCGFGHLDWRRKSILCAVFVHSIKTKLNMVFWRNKTNFYVVKKIVFIIFHHIAEVLFVVFDHTLIIHRKKYEEATYFHGFTSWPWWEAKVIINKNGSYFVDQRITLSIHSFIFSYICSRRWKFSSMLLFSMTQDDGPT